jgi:hypothetical protein
MWLFECGLAENRIESLDKFVRKVKIKLQIYTGMAGGAPTLVVSNIYL